MFNSELMSGLFMPLIVGIENGLDKGMTESDLSLTNGFGFGVMCMHAGVGRIDDDRYTQSVSVKEFRRRLLLINEVYEIFNRDAFAKKMTIEFVQKMKDADWSANVSTISKRAFNTQFKKTCASMTEESLDDRLKKLAEEEE